VTRRPARSYSAPACPIASAAGHVNALPAEPQGCAATILVDPLTAAPLPTLV